MQQISDLKAALDRYGPQKLLCVQPAAAGAPGVMKLIASGLKVAPISQFASYERVTLAAYGEWTAMLDLAAETPWQIKA